VTNEESDKVGRIISWNLILLSISIAALRLVVVLPTAARA
jgi:hypothetical protein